MKKGIVLFVAAALLFSAIPAFYFGWLGSYQVLSEASFTQLPDWQTADHSPALQAFQKSCVAIMEQDPNKAFSNLTHSGKTAAWQSICQAAEKLTHSDKNSARKFFETWFQPYQVSNHFQTKGLFTGYYLPLIHASLQRDDKYNVPVYGMPKDLVAVDLGNFNPQLRGQTIIARMKNHSLMPYPDRGAIDNGAIEDTAPVLLWADDPIDVFFAQIQGSASVLLPNQQKYLLSFAGTNGRPYTSIGKVLIDKKELTKDAVSMQSIRQWLADHKEEAQGILAYNASYVFFTLDQQFDKPIGVARVALTPQRTLAVDTRYIPLGAPVWLDTTVPDKNSDKNQKLMRQLLIAQDSGGAIRGVVRGDVYWGAGEDAAFRAGHMQSPGRYWVLLPRYMPRNL